MNSRHRIYLLIAFLLASALVVLIAIRDENTVPIYLIGSWGFAIGTIAQLALMWLFPNHGFGLGLRWLVIIITFSSYLLYLLGLMKLNSRLSHKICFPVPFIPLAIHTAGALLCLRVLTSGAESDPFPWLPAVLVIVYFVLDWQSALRGRGARGMINGNGQPQVK